LRKGRDVGPVRPDDDRPRINHQIRIPEIRVIGPDGAQLGLMSPDQAREIANEHGLDLVEVAANVRPPVCRIMDYGKYLYEQSKKKSAARASQTRVELKVIQVRPKIDDHDLETKMRKAIEFLQNGDRVRLVMRMRGREQAYPARWIEKMDEIAEELKDYGQMTGRPQVEGRTIATMFEPLRQSSASAGSAAAAPQPAQPTPQPPPQSPPPSTPAS
jgi:translation initiation factor IF-3